MQLTEERIEEIIANSYKNFHAKGMDYLCLKRTEWHTQKVYFLDGDVTKIPEVINPHNHRYDFRTQVLAGVMSNSEYIETEESDGKVYQEFEWRTPLLGGDGFTWKKETRLFETKRFFYRKDGFYGMDARDFHTIRMHADQTVLLLDQWADIVPEDEPTITFVPDKTAPSLDGLYERFTADEITKRVKILNSLGMEL